MKKFENSKIPRLFEMMNEKGVKGVDITRDLHISSGNISDWKNGKSAPSRGTLTSLANYLGTTAEYLLGETDIKEKPSEQTEDEELVAEFIELMESLSDDELQQTMNFIKFIKQQNKQ